MRSVKDASQSKYTTVINPDRYWGCVNSHIGGVSKHVYLSVGVVG